MQEGLFVSLIYVCEYICLKIKKAKDQALCLLIHMPARKHLTRLLDLLSMKDTSYARKEVDFLSDEFLGPAVTSRNRL